MTPLDQSLQALHEDPENKDLRHHFYSLFLQTDFQTPVFDEASGGMLPGSGDPDNPEKALPLIMEADGANYLMLFDTSERVSDWAGEAVKCLSVPGYVAVAMATEGLHLAMNVGTDYPKQFIPEEIAWLKQVVEESTAGKSE